MGESYRQVRGRAGEEAAAQWYSERGFAVLDRNWRCPVGELDLVVARGSLIVFCEVKTRSSEVFGSPVDAVTSAKRRRLRRLAASWLSQHGLRGRVRFDVVGVLDGQVDVVEDAF